MAKQKPKKSWDDYQKDALRKKRLKAKKIALWEKEQSKEVDKTSNFNKLGREKIGEVIYSLASFMLPLSIYLITAPRTVTGFGDSGGLITNSFLLSAAHPPGYPLFIILGKLFTFLPIGTIAFRLSIMSSLMGAFTSFFIYRILKNLSIPRSISFVGSQLVAFSYSLWLYSIIPEVFVLNNLIAVIIIYLLTMWQTENDTLQPREESVPSQAMNQRLPYLIFLMFGLGFSNHFTISLLLPGALYLLYKHGFFKTRTAFLKMSIPFFIGITPYLLLPISAKLSTYPHYGNLGSLSRTIQYITRYDYGGLLSGGDKGNTNPNEAYFGMFYHYVKLVLSGFTLFLLPGLLYFLYKNILGNDQKKQALAITTIITGIMFPIFALRNVGETDLHTQGVSERFGLLGMLFIFMAAVIGTYHLLSRLTEKGPEKIMLAFLSMVVAILIFGNFPKANMSKMNLTKDYGENILSQVENGDIIITSDDLTSFAILYLTQVERIKPEVKLISSGFISNPAYQQEIKEKWPGIFSTGSKYKYDIIRDIIKLNSVEKGVYFVMLDDPYPMGYLGNPYFFQPQGLLFKADPKYSQLDAASSAGTDYWNNYNYQSLTEDHSDPFLKLNKSYYLFKTQVNAQYYNHIGCVHCVEKELSDSQEKLGFSDEIKETMSDTRTVTDPPPTTSEELIKLAISRFAYGLPGGNQIDRSIWDLKQAQLLEPENDTALGGLGEAYEMVGLYDMAIDAYTKANNANPEGGWEQSIVNAKKQKNKIDIIKYF